MLTYQDLENEVIEDKIQRDKEVRTGVRGQPWSKAKIRRHRIYANLRIFHNMPDIPILSEVKNKEQYMRARAQGPENFQSDPVYQFLQHRRDQQQHTSYFPWLAQIHLIKYRAMPQQQYFNLFDQALSEGFLTLQIKTE